MVDVKEAFTRKIGPLPAWAWGAVIGGGFLVYRAVSGGGSGGASSPFVQPIAGGTPIDYGDGGSSGGGGGGGTPGPAGPPGEAPAWLPDPVANPYNAALARFRAGTTGAYNPGNYEQWFASQGRSGGTQSAQEFLAATLAGLPLSLPATTPRPTTPTTPTTPTPNPTPAPSPTPAPTSYAYNDALARFRAGVAGAFNPGTYTYWVSTAGSSGGKQSAAEYTAAKAAGVPLAKPPSTATGDTGSAPPVLGLPWSRAMAVAETQAATAAAFATPGPVAPSFAIAIPGTYQPALPPLLAVQADTERGWPQAALHRAQRRLGPSRVALAARARARGARIPTTINHPFVTPAPVRDLAQRIRPTPAG